MAEQYIFTIEQLHKFYNKREVLKNIWLAFYPGAKIGVIGGNGSGKSTLLRIMAGADKDFMGTARLTSGFTVGFVPQEPRLDETKDVRGNVEEAVAVTRALLTKHEEIGNKLGDCDPAEMDKLLEKLGEIGEKIEAVGGWDLDRHIDIAMDAMRLPPGDAEIVKLSGGEKRRVALCKILLQKPDLLLLDEPTNHLDADSVAWLERHLLEYTGTVVSVTHDRYFLDNAAQWILELDRGAGHPYKGNYTGWLEQKKARMDKEERTENARRKTLERELRLVPGWPGRARIAKNKARLTAYEKMAAQEVDEKKEDLVMQIPPGPHLGDVVVRAESVSKSFGDNVLMEDLNFDLPRGGIVGIIGPNGAGKTTLFRMIMGTEKPDSGKLQVGSTVVPSYVDQSRDTLVAENSVYEEISGGAEYLMLGKTKVASRGYVSWFNFKGPEQQRKVGELSGGERNRVHLAKLLRKGGNLLLLDEPTNDLDVETLRSLEDALLNFGGCAVVITHDRWFLDRIATHILAFEGDSKVVWCEGNYQAYEAQRRQRLGADADQPHRIKYRKLTH